VAELILVVLVNYLHFQFKNCEEKLAWIGILSVHFIWQINFLNIMCCDTHSQSSSITVYDNDWTHFQLLLQQTVRRSRVALVSDFATILINSNFRGRPVDKREVSEFVNGVIMRRAPRHTHDSVVLVLGKGIEVVVDRSSMQGHTRDGFLCMLPDPCRSLQQKINGIQFECIALEQIL
jgi:hypothetical protein